MNSVKVKVQDISFISETVNRLHDMFLQCTLLLDLKILETWTILLACDYAMALHPFHNSIPTIQSWTIFGGGRVWRARSTKRMKAQIFNMLQTWLAWVSHWERKVRNKDKKERGEKLIVAQGGTPTRDLANGLPCSNQPSYRVSRALQNFSQGRLFFIWGGW